MVEVWLEWIWTKLPLHRWDLMEVYPGFKWRSYQCCLRLWQSLNAISVSSRCALCIIVIVGFLKSFPWCWWKNVSWATIFLNIAIRFSISTILFYLIFLTCLLVFRRFHLQPHILRLSFPLMKQLILFKENVKDLILLMSQVLWNSCSIPL